MKLDPKLRVATATPLPADGLQTWVGYVDALLEMNAEWGHLDADDEEKPGDAVALQQMAFMARMMATCLQLQAENDRLRRNREFNKPRALQHLERVREWMDSVELQEGERFKRFEFQGGSNIELSLQMAMRDLGDDLL